MLYDLLSPVKDLKTLLKIAKKFMFLTIKFSKKKMKLI
jgi:hypothetical protein